MSQESPFFSIIIPVFNGANYIKSVLCNLFAQTNSSYEIIIVDDGSTDSIQEVILTYLSDLRVRYYYQTKKGVSAARNKGVENANGKFLIFIDCDDHPYPELVDKYYKCIEQNPETLLICSQYNYQGKIKGLQKNSYVFNSPISVIAGSYSICKKLFIDIGCFDEDMTHSENWELMLRVGLYPKMKVKYISIIKEPLLHYTAVYSQPKFLAYKIKKIESYSSLCRKHQDRIIYSSIYLSVFAQVVAKNYAGLGDLNNLTKWTFKSIYYNPFKINNYFKPILIFIKRKIIPYPKT
jgi:glycosyltransferase involved in cell wall biosynthesis